jgi:DNA-binding CsgD family transcriptional regulator
VAAAQRARAEVLLAASEADRAGALSLDAAAAEDGSGVRVAAARSRILAGRALAAGGRKDVAPMRPQPEVIGSATGRPRSWVPQPEPIASGSNWRNPVPHADVREAVAVLRRAEDDLAEYGALRLADEAARELRRLGRRVTRAGRRAGSDDLGLTRREIEVAGLVTTGKSNREIAAELFLSEKTVESHLSNVFTKLGVTSRAAVAAVLARHLQD